MKGRTPGLGKARAPVGLRERWRALSIEITQLREPPMKLGLVHSRHGYCASPSSCAKCALPRA